MVEELWPWAVWIFQIAGILVAACLALVAALVILAAGLFLVCTPTGWGLILMAVLAVGAFQSYRESNSSTRTMLNNPDHRVWNTGNSDVAVGDVVDRAGRRHMVSHVFGKGFVTSFESDPALEDEDRRRVKLTSEERIAEFNRLAGVGSR